MQIKSWDFAPARLSFEKKSSQTLFFLKGGVKLSYPNKDQHSHCKKTKKTGQYSNYWIKNPFEIWWKIDISTNINLCTEKVEILPQLGSVLKKIIPNFIFGGQFYYFLSYRSELKPVEVLFASFILLLMFWICYIFIFGLWVSYRPLDTFEHGVPISPLRALYTILPLLTLQTILTNNEYDLQGPSQVP